MKRYLLDTSLLAAYLHNRKTAVSLLSSWVQHDEAATSILVYGEIIEYIKVNRIDLPVAVVSAVSQQMLMRLDLDVVKLVIPKPFDVDEFTKAIVKICREE